MKPCEMQTGPGEALLQVFNMNDYLDASALWRDTPSVGLSGSDRPDAIAAFLSRNPGLSFVARLGRTLVGTVLCGHDGRRGYLYHVAVDTRYRRGGLGRRLVEASLQALAAAGIGRCHLMVFADNAPGLAFWRSIGAAERKELNLYSMAVAIRPASPEGCENAHQVRHDAPLKNGGIRHESGHIGEQADFHMIRLKEYSPWL